MSSVFKISCHLSHIEQLFKNELRKYEFLNIVSNVIPLGVN